MRLLLCHLALGVCLATFVSRTSGVNENSLKPNRGREKKQDVAASRAHAAENSLKPNWGREKKEEADATNENALKPNQGREKKQEAAASRAHAAENSLKPNWGREKKEEADATIEDALKPNWGPEKKEEVDATIDMDESTKSNPCKFLVTCGENGENSACRIIVTPARGQPATITYSHVEGGSVTFNITAGGYWQKTRRSRHAEPYAMMIESMNSVHVKVLIGKYSADDYTINKFNYCWYSSYEVYPITKLGQHYLGMSLDSSCPFFYVTSTADFTNVTIKRGSMVEHRLLHKDQIYREHTESGSADILQGIDISANNKIALLQGYSCSADAMSLSNLVPVDAMQLVYKVPIIGPGYFESRLYGERAPHVRLSVVAAQSETIVNVGGDSYEPPAGESIIITNFNKTSSGVIDVSCSAKCAVLLDYSDGAAAQWFTPSILSTTDYYTSATFFVSKSSGDAEPLIFIIAEGLPPSANSNLYINGNGTDELAWKEADSGVSYVLIDDDEYGGADLLRLGQLNTVTSDKKFAIYVFQLPTSVSSKDCTNYGNYVHGDN